MKWTDISSPTRAVGLLLTIASQVLYGMAVAEYMLELILKLAFRRYI